ncbi:MAG: hypothetical protein ACRD8W_19285 [Nitrososphaeraceae archaeon]
MIAGISHQLPQVSAWTESDIDPVAERKAPIATSGDNVYIVWFADKGNLNTNGEVIIRASNDGGITFEDKINLSNSNDTDSINAEIAAAEGDNVIVKWWDRANETSNQPVLRISTDSGQTFDPLLQLSTNETIGGDN